MLNENGSEESKQLKSRGRESKRVMLAVKIIFLAIYLFSRNGLLTSEAEK